MMHLKPGLLSAIGLLLIAFLTGCSSTRPPSYVVLLPSPDGTVGQVVITGQRGQQVLTQAQQGTWLDGGGAPFTLAKTTIDSDFNAALAARPLIPERFMLFFEVGGTVLTPESRTVLKQLLERARSFPALDISVVGHTDTLGSSSVNEALALRRARYIAGELKRLDAKDMAIAVESQGKRNLLVPTPDETAEQRNRRVEVTLR
jgi:outer membrane protein OmpA-like peptidoglycan-associated protein